VSGQRMRFIEGIIGAGRRRLEVARAQRLKRTKKSCVEWATR
jgi:hypothetical protein